MDYKVVLEGQIIKLQELQSRAIEENQQCSVIMDYSRQILTLVEVAKSFNW